MKPIRWDGRELTADRILLAMPAMTISWWGGDPGKPREVFIHRGKQQIKVKRGQIVGVDSEGNPCVMRGSRDQ